MNQLQKAASKAGKSLLSIFPLLIGIIFLISLINNAIKAINLERVFGKNIILDSLIGSTFGSLLAGNPVTSYIIGGELMSKGVSLVAITAFLTSWVTVGVIQFPAEAKVFGIKLALTRNILSFLFSILIAIITVFLYEKI